MPRPTAPEDPPSAAPPQQKEGVNSELSLWLPSAAVGVVVVVAVDVGDAAIMWVIVSAVVIVVLAVVVGVVAVAVNTVVTVSSWTLSWCLSSWL